ncbi:AAA family ATPase [Aurantimonas endophytica]|uniref:SpoVK/Ycf46/Vps4 family AAA+-type ATPase n=1 Tax=Aurantimonas endophytica TaxID=1522175 RepID=A0A7W6MMV0_9HYPH|nr:SpoVK/Ycf46/Vps4 family AAA+-type ATPase [Aurantimonas endophytica]MCO6403094.1 AAA family ATPase [Aurantimonas endophytica]
MLHNVPCTIGIVGVDEGSITAITYGARDILGAWVVGSLGHDVSIYDRTGSRRRNLDKDLRSLIVEAAKGGDRSAVLLDTMDDVSPAFSASAEGIVVLEPVDRALVRAAFMVTAKRAPGPEGLDLVASLPLDLIDSVIAPRRSVERSLGIAKRLLAAVRSEGHPVDDAAEVPEEPVDGPRLEDLSGLGEVGEWGNDLVRDLADYRSGAIPWSDVDRGVLVAGPPGVGKTMFAGALARSCGIPLHIHSCASWQSRGHLGDLLKAMTRAFDEARRAAPCILFLDEMDAFGSRTDPGDRYAAYSRQVIDGLLEQLDGAKGREGVVVVGATNHANLIDEAILRPGRLERVLVIQHPDRTARVGILRHHLRGTLERADLRPVAERLEGSTGAEIELLVRDARRRARKRREEMRLADIEASAPSTEECSDALFRRICVHEAGHLVVGALLADISGSDPIEAKVDRRLYVGVANRTDFVRRSGFDLTRDSFLAEITTLLAGLAAEEEVLESRGSGAGGVSACDLRSATELATAMEVAHGLGEALLHRAKARERLDALLDNDGDLRRRVSRTLDECFGRARELVESERRVIERVAQELASFGMCSASIIDRATRQDLETGTSRERKGSYVRQTGTRAGSRTFPIALRPRTEDQAGSAAVGQSAPPRES